MWIPIIFQIITIGFTFLFGAILGYIVGFMDAAASRGMLGMPKALPVIVFLVGAVLIISNSKHDFIPIVFGLVGLTVGVCATIHALNKSLPKTLDCSN